MKFLFNKRTIGMRSSLIGSESVWIRAFLWQRFSSHCFQWVCFYISYDFNVGRWCTFRNSFISSRLPRLSECRFYSNLWQWSIFLESVVMISHWSLLLLICIFSLFFVRLAESSSILLIFQRTNSFINLELAACCFSRALKVHHWTVHLISLRFFFNIST